MRKAAASVSVLLIFAIIVISVFFSGVAFAADRKITSPGTVLSEEVQEISRENAAGNPIFLLRRYFQ